LLPVEVKLHIGRGRIGKARIKPLAIEIVDTIEKYLPPSPGRCEIDNTGEEGLAAEVNSIRMIRFPNQIEASFFAPRSAWILSIDAIHLQSVVSEKAKRLPGYLASCDEVWLLMAAEGDKLFTTVECRKDCGAMFLNLEALPGSSCLAYRVRFMNFSA
jgi:hypothetical protein